MDSLQLFSSIFYQNYFSWRWVGFCPPDGCWFHCYIFIYMNLSNLWQFFSVSIIFVLGTCTRFSQNQYSIPIRSFLNWYSVTTPEDLERVISVLCGELSRQIWMNQKLKHLDYMWLMHHSNERRKEKKKWSFLFKTRYVYVLWSFILMFILDIFSSCGLLFLYLALAFWFAMEVKRSW